MRRYTCFCDTLLFISSYEDLWSMMPQKTAMSLEGSLNAHDALSIFNCTYKSYKDQCREAVLCPACSGISIFELRVNHYANMYYLPEKHYEPFLLAPPALLSQFICACDKSIDTSNLQNQWTMIPQDELLLDHVAQAFEDHESVDDYYRRLYSVGRRVITCPHCSGITVAECDSDGNGLKGVFYAKKDELVGDEFE